MTQTKNQSTPQSPHPLDSIPADVRWLLRSVWDRIPETQQKKLKESLPLIPQDSTAGLKKLYELGEAHLRMAFGQQHRVAIVGPANVGKSTLFNQLIRSGEQPAAVSPVPGTTITNQTASAALFQLIDTPGVDAVGTPGQNEREEALRAAGEADFLVILFDAIQGVKTPQQAMFEDLKKMGKPFLAALNKMDLISKRDRDAVVHTAAHNLGLQPGDLLPISALEDDGVGALLLTIAGSEPALLTALGDALPEYRGRLAWQATLRAATSASVVALTPIPIIDFLPLAAIQGLLVLTIGRIYRYKITPARAKELLGTLGLGYVGRVLFYELTRLGGPPTWIISVAIAASMTILVGYSAMLWFEKGEKLTTARARELLKSITRQLVERLKSRGKKRPRRKKFAKSIRETLEDLNLGEIFSDPEREEED